MNEKHSQDQREPGFQDFLLAEYSNIAEAYFKMLDTISSFFQHYLTIMSVPIALIVVFSNLGSRGADFTTIVLELSPLIAVLFFVISMVGLCVMWYIVALRSDALLYARTINGIRKHFYDNAHHKRGYKAAMRVLPQSPHIPPYREYHLFLPVVLAFSLLDVLYFLFAFYALSLSVGWLTANQFGLQALLHWRGVAASAGFFVLHLAAYWLLTARSELGHLGSHIIGVDIDGVLNNHRLHFCDLLNKTVGKRIQPDAITAIPVHEVQGLGVTTEDAVTVFNDPAYWIDMPPIEGGADALKHLRNSYNLEVFIFTSRAWPNFPGIAGTESDKHKRTWNTQTDTYERQVLGNMRWWEWLTFWAKLLRRDRPCPLARPGARFGRNPIDRITKLWLHEHGFEWDNIMIEKSNKYATDRQGRMHNRFSVSKAKKIRFFVEDDPTNAAKLAFICDFVFLIDHPYNQTTDQMPRNVIRVDSWQEIMREMKTLL